MSYLHVISNAPCRAARGPTTPHRAAPLHLRRSPACALRPRGGARVAAGVAGGPRAEHVAVPRADAALRRRAAAHARRRLDAADARADGSARLWASERLYVKDESLNPTNSFKARGLSAAVTRAAHLGAKTLSVPSAGNAANAMAAYAAARRNPRAACSCRRTSKPRSSASASCTGRTSRSSTASSPMPDGSRPNRASRSAGMTSPRSRSPTASRARRPWPTS